CDENANPFGRVAGRFQKAQHYLAHSDLFAVSHGSMLKLDTGLRAEDDLCAGARRDLLMTADEVGVQVRFDHVFDLQTLRVSFGEIFVDVTLRIDDRSFAVRADQVRRMRQTGEIELFEVHFSKL